jgi:hypothetical protein
VGSSSSGGYISEGSQGGHTDKDIYGVLDREQEAQRPEIGQQDDGQDDRQDDGQDDKQDKAEIA